MKGEFVMLSKFISSLKQEFGGVNAAALTKDLMAGLTVAARCAASGACLRCQQWCGCRIGVNHCHHCRADYEPAFRRLLSDFRAYGAMAAILMSLVAAYGMDGVFIATLIAGIILLLAGILHLGKLTSFIPAPVITGFTSGIAVIIALGQVDNFFGTHSEGTSAIGKLFSYARLGFSPNLTAVGLGLFVVLFMVFFPKKWNAVVPASLVSIILTTAFSIFMQLDVAVVGEIPKTLIPENRLLFGALNLKTIGALVTPAFSIAILG